MSKVKELFDRACNYWKEESKRTLDTLAPPATSNDISALEKALHVTFPSEYKDLLRIHNGYKADSREYDRFEIGSFYHSHWRFYPTTGVEGIWKHKNGIAEEMFGNKKNDNVEAGIKPVYWNKHWVPVFNDSEGNSVCLDFDPDSSGKKGQLIYTDWERGGHKVIAENFIDGLEVLVDKLTGKESKKVTAEAYDLTRKNQSPIYFHW